MTRTRCLASPSYHLIPSVSLAPFHFSTYLPRSANHISVRRVTCFPVLQQPTLHTTLCNKYTNSYLHPRGFSRPLVISATFDRMHRSSCAGHSTSFALSVLPTCFDGLGEFGTSRARFYLLAQPSCRLTPYFMRESRMWWRMLVI